MNLGIMATINQAIDQETAQVVVEEMGHKFVLLKENAVEESLFKDLETKAPIISETCKNSQMLSRIQFSRGIYLARQNMLRDLALSYLIKLIKSISNCIE